MRKKVVRQGSWVGISGNLKIKRKSFPGALLLEAAMQYRLMWNGFNV